MTTAHQIIRILLVLAILYLGTAGLIGTIMAVLWGDGIGPDYTDMTEFNMAWVTLIVFCACSLVSCYGLLRWKPFGILFGYGTASIIFLMFLGEAYKHWAETGGFTREDIMWGTLFLGTPILLTIGLRTLQKAMTRPQAAAP